MTESSRGERIKNLEQKAEEIQRDLECLREEEREENEKLKPWRPQWAFRYARGKHE